jgi:hypothetical protein
LGAWLCGGIAVFCAIMATGFFAIYVTGNQNNAVTSLVSRLIPLKFEERELLALGWIAGIALVGVAINARICRLLSQQ